MTAAYDLFRPNGLKLLLAATLIVPVFFVIVLASSFSHSDMVLPAAIAIVISYLAACVIDQTVQSRTVKIAIASVAALVSIILGYLIIRGMTMVCDPVHEPGRVVCDPVHVPETTPVAPVQTVTRAPTVITTVQPAPTTPMIFDPVHEPNSCGPVCGLAPGITAGIVEQKLDECLKNCNR
jgi:hypothetical protein